MCAQKRSLVIIPTYNERDNVELVLDASFNAAPDTHILFIDDGSPDRTAELIKEKIAKKPGQIHLIERQGKLGLGTAYIAGFLWGIKQGYDYLIEMDADLSHDPRVLPIMIGKLAQADVVIGSRYIKGGATSNWSQFRRLISKSGSAYARLILNMSIRDLTGGFNGWRREVLEAIDLPTVRSNGYSFQIELKHRAFKKGYSLREIPITFSERIHGQSKMSGGIVWEALLQVWRMRADQSRLSSLNS